MRRGMTSLLAVMVVCGLTLSAVYAGGPGCSGNKNGKTATAGDTAKSRCTSGTFPTMTMKVGDKTYQCPMEADKAAKAAKAKIVYLVADQTYDNRDEATVALATASEQYTGHFVNIGFVQDDGKVVYQCDKSGAGCTKTASAKDGKAGTGTCQHHQGTENKQDDAKTEHEGHGRHEGRVVGANLDPSKYRKFVVVGREFDNYDAAVKARDEAVAAIKQVKMTYIVDGKEVDCASKVCEKAKADGKVEYRVGAEKTNCEYSARVALAKAQYEAAKTIADKLAKA